MKTAKRLPQIVESKYFGASEFRITYNTREEAEKHLRAANFHEELLEAVRCVVPLLRLAAYPDLKDSPLIKRFEDLISRAQEAIRE